MKSILFFLLLLLPLVSLSDAQAQSLKIGVAGLNHGHVPWVLNADKRSDIEIVGIAEPNRKLAEKYANEYGFSLDLVYPSLDEMLEKTNPEAVTGFGTTFAHLEIVQKCAPKRIHVMVEKPLAVSLDHALQMQALATQHSIQLLTNYETTWYPSNEKAYEILQAGQIGEVRKIVVRAGHRGPKKIGVGPEFLEWLTDPELNGGGALMDFGCYGANLSTWLMQGEKPLSVTAVTQQLNPHDNPAVEDEATIILTYARSQTIIEASWNWPIGRKDMEVHGLTGTLFADHGRQLRLRIAEGYDGFAEEKFELEPKSSPLDDPFTMLIHVVRGKVKLKPYDLSSLENNLVVMEILQAAKESAASGKTVLLSSD